MREIKFRGVSVESGKFVYGYLVKVNNENEFCYGIKNTIYHMNTGFCNLTPVIVFSQTIGQFTSLKDKNGVEIYEGDILDSITGRHLEVVYSNEHAGFDLMLGNDSPISLYKNYAEKSVILGNIHGNQELS